MSDKSTESRIASIKLLYTLDTAAERIIQLEDSLSSLRQSKKELFEQTENRVNKVRTSLFLIPILHCIFFLVGAFWPPMKEIISLSSKINAFKMVCVYYVISYILVSIIDIIRHDISAKKGMD